jgi:hypothetical protein
VNEIAEQIVNAIIEDLTDRSGLSNEWINIDKEIQQEIKDEWCTIIITKLENYNDENQQEINDNKWMDRISGE